MFNIEKCEIPAESLLKRYCHANNYTDCYATDIFVAARLSEYIEALDMLASMRLCSNVPCQHAIQTALGGYQSITKPEVRNYGSFAWINN